MVAPKNAAGLAKQNEAAAAVAAEMETLTPEQRQIRELQDALAAANARNEKLAMDKEFSKPQNVAVESYDPVNPKDTPLRKEGNLLINFVEDGFTWAEKVWVKGQELEFEPGTPAYENTKDRYGKSWVNMTEGEQIDKWGMVFFRPGPWRGQSLLDAQFEALAALAGENDISLPDKTALLAAERKARSSGRIPPNPNSIENVR